MKIVAVIVIIIVGFLGSWIVGIIGASMNCPDAGAIFATVIMGAYTLWAVWHPKDREN